MKKISYLTASIGTLVLPMFASAQFASGTGDGGDLQVFMEGILNFINDFLIPFIIAIGFLVFVWGMFQYFIAGGANDEAKEKGKSLMIYATLGFVLIIVFWGIVNLLSQSIGLEGQSIANTPTIIIP